MSYRLNVTSESDGVLRENVSAMGLDSGQTLFSEVTSPALRPPPSRMAPGPPPFGLQGGSDPIVALFQAISMPLQRYGIPTYCSVGLLGNLLAVIVLLRSELWTLSAARYLLAVLVADVAYLTNLLIGWLGDVGVGVYNHGGLCHFTTFLSHGSCFLALWCLVCFAVDGYIRICFRRRQDRMCTTTRANVIILAFVAVAIAVFINISITFGVTSGPVLRCAPLKMFIVTLQTLFKIDIFLNSMLPDVAIIFMFCHALLVGVCCTCGRGGGGAGESGGDQASPGRCGCLCCARHTNSTPGESDIRISQEHTPPSLEQDFYRLYFVYLLISTCLNLSSHIPRIYYTIHGLLYPNKPLTMKDFVWQQLLIHAYYLRCSINIFIFFCASKNFRRVACSGVTLLGRCLRRLRQKGNPSGHPESGHQSAVAEEDDTVTALMKDTTTSSTTPV